MMKIVPMKSFLLAAFSNRNGFGSPAQAAATGQKTRNMDRLYHTT
jgi:hypothetical protein